MAHIVCVNYLYLSVNEVDQSAGIGEGVSCLVGRVGAGAEVPELDLRVVQASGDITRHFGEIF